MKLFAIAALLSIFVGVGLSQNKPAITGDPDQIRLLADHEIKDGGTLKLRGHVQVITSATTVYADEVDYRSLTGELDARGHVHIDFPLSVSKTQHRMTFHFCHQSNLKVACRWSATFSCGSPEHR